VSRHSCPIAVRRVVPTHLRGVASARYRHADPPAFGGTRVSQTATCAANSGICSSAGSLVPSAKRCQAIVCRTGTRVELGRRRDDVVRSDRGRSECESEWFVWIIAVGVAAGRRPRWPGRRPAARAPCRPAFPTSPLTVIFWETGVIDRVSPEFNEVRERLVRWPPTRTSAGLTSGWTRSSACAASRRGTAADDVVDLYAVDGRADVEVEHRRARHVRLARADDVEPAAVGVRSLTRSETMTHLSGTLSDGSSHRDAISSAA